MANRGGSAGLDMGEAANVGGRDDRGCAGLEGSHLVAQQLLRQLGLQDGVGPGGATAEVGIVHVRERVTRVGEDRLHDAADLEAVLQAAGRAASAATITSRLTYSWPVESSSPPQVISVIHSTLSGLSAGQMMLAIGIVSRW